MLRDVAIFITKRLNFICMHGHCKVTSDVCIIIIIYMRYVLVACVLLQFNNMPNSLDELDPCLLLTGKVSACLPSPRPHINYVWLKLSLWLHTPCVL